jgi:hypothetical protein
VGYSVPRVVVLHGAVIPRLFNSGFVVLQIIPMFSAGGSSASIFAIADFFQSRNVFFSKF